MSNNDLAVTLSYVAERHEGIRTEAELVSTGATKAATELTDLEAHAEALQEKLGIEARTTRPEPQPRSVPPPSEPMPVKEWNEIVSDAGIATSDRQVEIDDLLDKDEKARIERRFRDGFTTRTRLDRWDITAAVAAGVTAAMLDYFIVSTPRESGLTQALKTLSLDSDNWLSGIAKVPYDAVVGTGIEGMGPTTHRVQAFGHDPLLGWVYGTLDILRGSLTGVSNTGVMAVVDGYSAPTNSVLVAIGLQGLHLVSDIVTPAGLPLPGWTALLTVGGTAPGADASVSRLARAMYYHGYDTWHFLAMATPLVAIEAVLRGYLAARQHLDEEYRKDLDVERLLVGSNKMADLPRFETMTLIAQGIAAAGNAGRFALAGTNPLTLNYPLWLAFAGNLIRQLDHTRPTTTQVAHAHANRIQLDAGWASLDVDPDDLPGIEITD